MIVSVELVLLEPWFLREIADDFRSKMHVNSKEAVHAFAIKINVNKLQEVVSDFNAPNS